jgi:hypothetical protein
LSSGTFAQLLNLLQTLVPECEGAAHAIWGSDHPAHREQIRQSLMQRFADPELLNLKQIPRLKDRSISISHTRDFGGWLATPRPVQVGWDIEHQSRIREVIVRRTCTEQEIARAPHFSFLWSAKESLYKALEAQQPATVQELSIASWQALGPALWSLRSQQPYFGDGLLLQSKNSIVAACVVRHQA